MTSVTRISAAFTLSAVVLAGSPVFAQPAQDALTTARRWLETTAPAELERRLRADPALARPTMQALGAALARASDPLKQELEDYLIALARARGTLLAGRGGPWNGQDLNALVALQLVDPERFATDPEFRSQVLPVLLRALDPVVPDELRDLALHVLLQFPGVDFETSERIAWAWGAILRRSHERRTDFAPGELRWADPSATILASVYSLPSHFFDPATVDRFLTALRRLAPERHLLVIGDLPLRWSLGGRIEALDVAWIETYGRSFTPWPRDPLSLAWSPAGEVRVVVRPNVQNRREVDQDLGRMLVQGLPEELDEDWKRVRWSLSPVSFHNGQILLAREAVWISVHSVEPRILALLGEARVPVESFATAAGIERYLAAARRAADELATLYGRPARFVHPLPEDGALARRTAVMRSLGGGAGFDLDSLLTLLAQPGEALLADVTLGEELLARLAAADLAPLARGYDLWAEGEELRSRLAAAQATPRAVALDAFLDLLARHLEAQGRRVRRLPLFLIPTALLRDGRGVDHPDFLLTWNNVVVERRGGSLRAEGFSSLLPPGDELAREVFREAGCRLDLLPPLVHSVVLNGGYRCASNHLRAAAPEQTPLATGRALLAAKRYQDAAWHLRRAVELGTGGTVAHVLLASALWESGQIEEAETVLRRAVSSSGSVEARKYLGLLLLWQGRAAEAVDPLRTAAAADPDSAQLRMELARALEGSAQTAAAVVTYRQVIELAPDLPEAHYRLAILLARGGDLEAAHSELEIFRRLRAEQEELRREMGLEQARRRAAAEERR